MKRDIPAGWSRRTWGDVAVLRYGKALDDYRAMTEGVPVYGTNGRVGWTAAAPLCPHGGVVIGRKGAYRGIHYSPEPFFVIDTAFWLEPIEQMDLRWAYYQLLTHDINALDSGSAIPSTSRGDFYALKVLVPPVWEQRGIAATLGALDDKIESNRRTIAIAVELAQAALCGGSERVRLRDVATLDKGVSYKGAGLEGEQSARARPLVNLGNFPVGSGWMNRSKTKFYSGDFKARHVVAPGDVVVANTDLTQQRAVLGRAVLVPPDLGPSLFSHHVFAVRFHAREDLRLALWAQLATSAARDRLIGYATGTTVAGLPREALLDFMVVAPSSKEATVEAEALLELAWGRERELCSLAALRDALLPELLSGRLRVPEAGEAVGSALA